MDMLQFCDVAGANWYFQHRGDLWNEFCHLATAPSTGIGIGGQPAKIIWGADVVSVNVDSGEVKLADGTIIASDLVIAADGIKSIIRPLVTGEEAFRTARPSGTSAFRFIMPVVGPFASVQPRCSRRPERIESFCSYTLGSGSKRPSLGPPMVRQKIFWTLPILERAEGVKLWQLRDLNCANIFILSATSRVPHISINMTLNA
ncbi:hypothetical protein PV08_11052 [Exophiala spinifera]|uniref:FAD-binding domain-containing protein n=1 Tax=Exophiala spinifera TaxID=91928 RepID=A0A0D1ZAQ2_9EURO|nr:uncharacterized protein PV08_11052 [Exophiala spinifera]KIW10092.1 hypothetical protein PV08_11052 [Exophiala spinifera]